MAAGHPGLGRWSMGCAAAFLLAMAMPAGAEVRFGNNVRIGGHDASNQRFDRRNRGAYHIHEGRPRNPAAAGAPTAGAGGSRPAICSGSGGAESLLILGGSTASFWGGPQGRARNP